MPARPPFVIAALLVAGGIGVGVVVTLAARERADVARCPDGLIAAGPRCCGGGQRHEAGACTGVPSSCATGMAPHAEGEPGCVAVTRRIAIGGGELRLAQGDWQREGASPARAAKLAPFELDATEVTFAEWQRCVAAGACRAISSREPGLPVTRVTAEEAAHFCEARGGRLPSGAEWLYAAAGVEGRRFPWGATGLVCRRAAFGLLDGPCARGAAGPDLAGARPDGATPQGVQDLSGNVAEWTHDADGDLARGGGFRSAQAGELTSLSAVASGARDDVGFRCAYAAR